MSEAIDKTWPPRTRRLRIGGIEIDLHYRRVVRHDGEVELPQRMFELLLLFAAEPHVVHTRGELLQRVWPNLIVEDANLSQSVWMLRKALGEERKDWIRTIAKKGYVFEPSAPVEAIESPQAVQSVQARDLQTSIDDDSQPRPDLATPRRSWRLWTRYAAGAALVIGLSVLVVARMTIATRSPPFPASITLVEVNDSTVSDAARLPAELLDTWLEWKLSALPEITLLTPSQLAADPSARAANHIVLLFSGEAADDPARVFVRAQFDDVSGTHRFQVEGAALQMAALVDTVSTRVMRELVPARAQQRWPALNIDPATARQYVQMVQERRAHNWIRAADIGKSLTTRAPQFGLAHFSLAQSLGTLGQLSLAQEQLAAARALLQPIPPEADAMLRAQQLALSPRHEDAAAAYGALATRYPTQANFSLQQARAIGRTGRFAEAVALLSGPVWSRQIQPVSLQVNRLAVLSGLQLGLGDYARARVTAEQANRLVQASGPGWDYERGQVLLMLAQADVATADGTRDSPFFEDAAKSFERAGDSFSALRARFNGAISGPNPAPSAYVDAWLAQARAAGQQQLELSALRAVAFQHYRAGDIAGYRARLAQAVAVADTMADPWGMAALQTDLLNESFLRGDTVEVEHRLAQLHKQGMQGELALWAGQYAAVLAADRGEFSQALAALDGAELKAHAGQHPNDPAAAMAAVYACTRAGILVALGKPSQARLQYAHCAKGDAFAQLQARVGITEVNLLSGDRASALNELRVVIAGLQTIAIQPGRWGSTLDAAALLARAGEADAAARLYADVLPAVHAAGYRFFEAHARVGLAEVAMAQGNPGEARARAEVARTLVSPDNWTLGQRLQMLDIAMARANGDFANASRMLLALDQDARRHNDVLAQIRVHSWMSPPQSEGADPSATLIARSGLRGATEQWLMPDRVALAQQPTVETHR